MGPTENASVKVVKEGTDILPKYATAQEIQKAKLGVAEFRLLLARSGDKGRDLLTQSGLGKRIQLMFLGLKPLITVESDQDWRDFTAAGIHLPERIHTGDYSLYDENLCREFVNANPDIFSDFTDGTDINEYMNTFLYGKLDKLDTSRSESLTRIGVLLGYPRDAAMSHGRNADDANKFRVRCGRDADLIVEEKRDPPYILRTGTEVDSQETEEVILRFGKRTKEGGYRDDIFDLYAYLDEHEDQARSALRKIGEGEISDEQIKYLVLGRAEIVRGFEYAVGIPTEASLAFPKKVEEIYTLSGMDTVVT